MAAEEEEEKPVPGKLFATKDYVEGLVPENYGHIHKPDSGAIFTFGKSKFEEKKFWLKNDKPAQISCGDEHSVLITGNGKLYVFGSNINGQLGIGSGNVISKPKCVKALKSEKVKFTASGRNHTLLCTVQGKVYSSGWNSEGQLGHGDTTERTSFHEIVFFSSQTKIKQLSAGSNTSAALTGKLFATKEYIEGLLPENYGHINKPVDGKLFMWGENSEGQLGLSNEKCIYSPCQVDIGKPISWVSCGYYHSAFITQDGELYTFGEPDNGKLGLPPEKLEKHRQPQRVPGIMGKVKMVSCGGGHTIAVTDKEVYTFGLGQFGQLGHGTSIFEMPAPKVIDALKPHRIRYVACGESHTAVITDKGLLYTFGDGRYGKLGLGEENFTNQFLPTLCRNFLKFNVQSVACGGCHMLVFAIPRTNESEAVIDDLKENLLTINEDLERSITLQRSPSARMRRREKKYSPDQIRSLTRTLPPLSGNLLESSLPVPSNTIPPSLLKIRQESTESSANELPTVSKSDGKSQKDLVKSFSTDDETDGASQKSFGGTTDILNMTHVVRTKQGNSTFSPVQKRKKNIKNVELKAGGKAEIKGSSRCSSSFLRNKSLSFSGQSETTSVDAHSQTLKRNIQNKFRKASEAGKSKYAASQEQLDATGNDCSDMETDASLSNAQRINNGKQKTKGSIKDMVEGIATSLVTSESDNTASSRNKLHYHKTPKIIHEEKHESLGELQRVSGRNKLYSLSKNTSSFSYSSDKTLKKDVTPKKDTTKWLNGSETLQRRNRSKSDRVEHFKQKPSSSSTECSEKNVKPTNVIMKKKGKILIVRQKESMKESAIQSSKMAKSDKEPSDCESEAKVSNEQVGQHKKRLKKDNRSREVEGNLERGEEYIKESSSQEETNEVIKDYEGGNGDAKKAVEENTDEDETEQEESEKHTQTGKNEKEKEEDAEDCQEDDDDNAKEGEEEESAKESEEENKEEAEEGEGEDESKEEAGGDAAEEEEEAKVGEEEEIDEEEGEEGEEEKIDEEEEAEEEEEEAADDEEEEEEEEAEEEEEEAEEEEEEAADDEEEEEEEEAEEEEEEAEEEEEEAENEEEQEDEEAEDDEEEEEEEEAEDDEEEEEEDDDEEEEEEDDDEEEEEEDDNEEEEEEDDDEEEAEDDEEEEEEEDDDEEEEEDDDDEEEEEGEAEEGEKEEEEEGGEEETEWEEDEENETEDENKKDDKEDKSKKPNKEKKETHSKKSQKKNVTQKPAKETNKQKKNVKNIRKLEIHELENKVEQTCLKPEFQFWDDILPQYLTLK